MSSLRKFFALLLCIILLLSAACRRDVAPGGKVLVSDQRLVNSEVQKLLTTYFSGRDTLLALEGDTLAASQLVRNWYVSRTFTPAWTDKGRLLPAADSLFRILVQAGDFGLLAADYHTLRLTDLIRSRYDSASATYDARKLFEADVLLTDAFYRFAVDVSCGRLNPDSLTREFRSAHLDTNYVALLNQAIRGNRIRPTFHSLEPRFNEYQFLKRALFQMRRLYADSPWDSLRSRESDSLTFRDRLVQRLKASKDYCDSCGGSDSMRLFNAIRNFQCRHYLTEDGKVGKLTFRALQRTREDYIRQIEMNMERWRWRKPPAEEAFVWVNIPKYEMKVVEDDTVVMRSRVIVGEDDHQTPQLKSTIRYFIIYPYWTVPYSIATKELLPILKRDTSYLRRKNFEVLDGSNSVVDASRINWKRYSTNYFPWKLRQRIGDDNSLGILKFNFENKYGVYLHDTDSRRLFGREMRALSHGCVRLEKFRDFARFLVRDDSLRYPADSLYADLEREKQKYVYLRKPIPVYLTYFTAEADANGHLYFFLDVYRRDEKMRKALY